MTNDRQRYEQLCTQLGDLRFRFQRDEAELLNQLRGIPTHDRMIEISEADLRLAFPQSEEELIAQALEAAGPNLFNDDPEPETEGVDPTKAGLREKTVFGYKMIGRNLFNEPTNPGDQ